MVIPDKAKAVFEKIDLIAVGTADNEGTPNVVPIFWKKITDKDTILLVDNFMHTTKDNILKNAKVCISFWDSQTEEGYKLKGTATYHTKGTFYDTGKKFIQEKNPERIPKGVVEIKVAEVYDITPGPNAGSRIA